MQDKYLSIITNFGCHGKCPYCIVRENGINVPKTTVKSLNYLMECVNEYGANIISISGGGDPLHQYMNHVDYYAKLWKILEENQIPLEMHTSYIDSYFRYECCQRVVYHLIDIKQLENIRRHGSEVVRVVFVATDKMSKEQIMYISEFVHHSTDIDELSFRQMVDSNYQTKYFNHELLIEGHKSGLWHYIEQNDYNLYFVEGKVYKRFSDIGGK